MPRRFKMEDKDEIAPEYSGFCLLLTILSFVITFSIFPLVSNSIVSLLTKSMVAEEEDEKKLRKEILEQRQKLKTIHMVDEFAKYAKVERLIIKLTEQKKKYDSERGNFVQKLKIGVTVGSYVLKGVITVILFLLYRNTPLIVLPDEWTRPIGSFVSLPSGVPGGVGLVFWLLICNTTVNQLLKLLGPVK